MQYSFTNTIQLFWFMLYFNFVFFFKSGYLWPTKAKVDWPVCGDCCFHSQFFSNIHTLSSNQSK